MAADTDFTVKKALTWLAVIVAIAAVLKLAGWLVRAVFAFGSFLLFGLGPIILVGWLVVRLVSRFRDEPV